MQQTAKQFLPAIAGGLCGAGVGVFMTRLQEAPLGLAVAIGLVFLLTGVLAALLSADLTRRWARIALIGYVVATVLSVLLASRSLAAEDRRADQLARLIIQGEAAQMDLVAGHAEALRHANDWISRAQEFVRDEYGVTAAAILTSTTGIADETVVPLINTEKMRAVPEPRRSLFFLIENALYRMQELGS